MRKAIVAALFGFVPALASSAEDVSEIIERVNPSIVVIEAIDGDGQSVGRATGFAVAPKGVIATNVHVLEGGSRFKITRSDGISVVATGIWCFDRPHDIALVQLSDPEGKGDLPPLPMAKEETIRPGKPVYVVGHPQSLRYTVTSGILSSIDRRLSDFNEELPKAQVIQTDAATAPGSSGGPWLNSAGEVVGVHRAGLSGFGLQGFNFATHVSHLNALLARERKKPLPTDHFNRPDVLNGNWRTILPPQPNGRVWFTSLRRLDFAGAGGDVNELGTFSIDGEWNFTSDALRRSKGPHAAVSFGRAEDFVLEGDAQFGGDGGFFILLGWNDGSGYLFRSIQLKSSSDWKLWEMKDGKPTGDGQKISIARFSTRLTFKLDVDSRELSFSIGNVPVAKDVRMPNYREGSVIFGVYPTQYGPKPVRFVNARIRAK